MLHCFFLFTVRLYWADGVCRCVTECLLVLFSLSAERRELNTHSIIHKLYHTRCTIIVRILYFKLEKIVIISNGILLSEQNIPKKCCESECNYLCRLHRKYS